MDFIIRDEPVVDAEGNLKPKVREEEFEQTLNQAIENIKEKEFEQVLDQAIENIRARKEKESEKDEATPEEKGSKKSGDTDITSVLAGMDPKMAQLYLFLDLAQRMGLKLGTERPSKGSDEELLDRLIDFGKMLGLVLQGMSKPLSDIEDHIYKRESVMLDNLLKREELLWKLQKRRPEESSSQGEHLGKGHLRQE